MTEVGSVYGAALYDLAVSEGLSTPILEQLQVLNSSFAAEGNFLKLLCAPGLSKQERCGIVDSSFRGKVHPYVLNFLKILTEKGYARHFHHCFAAYEEKYNQDNGILVVTALTAIPLSAQQTGKLCAKLETITGSTIRLHNKVDPSVLGGVQLDLGNRRIDDTVAHRLQSVRDLLKQTTL
jgi:F-type H+-transporting ATPase subunit delta